MTTLFTLINVYDELSGLPRATESVERAFAGRVEQVRHVFIDGKYPDWPGDHDFSNDGSLEWCEAHGTLLMCADDECAKRTAGLSYIDTQAQDGDWVLYLDADEEITSIFAMPRRVGYINFTRKTHREIQYGRCRLYRWEPGLSFKHRHYDLYDASDELVSSLESAPSFDVVGHGNHYEKPRTEAKKSYFRILRPREGHPAEAVRV